MFAPAAASACALAAQTYTATGTNKVVDAHTCDTQMADNNNTWGGLFTVNTGDAYSFFGIGVDDFGNPASPATTFTTANATYTIAGNLSNDNFTITLVSVQGGTGTDTLSFFTCPGQQTTTTCITTQTTTIAVNIPLPPLQVTPTTVPAGTSGTAYSQTLGAVGGTGPYSFTETGALPAGVTFSTAGVLSGTPTAGGTFPITVTVTDSATPTAGTAAQPLSLVIGAPTITVSPTTAALTAGTAGVAYSQTFTASGGVGAHTFTVSAGALPAGLTLATNGTLSGTPTAGGNFSFTVKAVDNSTGTGPFNGTRAYTLSIGAPTIAVTPTTVPAATVAAIYSQSFSATGGDGTYTFSVSAGALPAGLSLSTAGVLSGTPTAGGPFNFTVKAVDQSTGTGPFNGTQAISLTVNAPTVAVSPGSLPDGVSGTAYTQTVSAGGGTSPYTFAVTSGALPTGLSLSTGGAITGTPTANGPYSFTITATDHSTGTGPYTGSQGYSVNIGPAALAVSTTTLTGATAGVAYSQSVSATGGVPSYSFAVTSGALPAGVNLSTTGALTGTPTAVGTFNFTVTVTDSATPTAVTASQPLTLTVAAPTIVVSPASLTGATAGTAYSQTISTTGGDGTSTFAVTAGALPAGVTLSTGGLLSGTPTAAGSFNFTVTATDQTTGTGAPFTGAKAYTLSVAGPTIVVSPTTLPGDLAGTAYSQTVTGGGGDGPYTFAVTAGALPTGLSLSTGGAITGTPSTPGPFSFTITATDATTGTGAPFTGSRAYSVTIGAAVSVTPSTLPGGTVGTAYNQSVAGANGTSPYTFAVTAGALPTGLSLNASTGAITGTPTAVASSNFTITATDHSTGPGSPFSGSQAYTVAIAAPTITVSPSSLTSGTVGTSFSQTLTGGGGTGPYTFAVTSGALPTGLTLSPGGAISGTPSAFGGFTFTVTATDHSTGTGAPFTGSQAYTVNIVAVIVVAPGSFSDAVVGAPISTNVTASGGTGPYTFSVTAGALPTGLTLSSAGAITGTPNPAGTYNFTITATDHSGSPGPYSGSQAYTWHVVDPTLILTTLPDGQNGIFYSQQIDVSGGHGPYTFAVTAGSLPTGLTLSSTTGVLSGTPTVNASFPFTVTATDSSSAGIGGPFTGSQTYDVAISDLPPPSVPTLNDWWALLLSGALALAGAIGLARRKARGL